MTTKICLEHSINFEKKCSKIIPAGSSTLAKSPHRLASGYSPFYAESASGSHFTDIDDNLWLDCEMAMGTVVWGYNRQEINEAIIAQLQKGTLFSIPSTLEYELAERLLHRFPDFQAVKYFKNGADSVYAAVRSARRMTGRDMTLSCEYHGWLDWCSPTYYNCRPSELGIPEDMKAFHISCTADERELLKKINEFGGQLACVVLCPANYSPDTLKSVIDLCHSRGVYVIFDEVTSGIRFAYGGATTKFHLSPDFLCISKGLTNGLPLAVVMGRTEEILLMERLQISNAHAGEHLSLAAAIACEKLLSQAVEWPTWGKQTDSIMNRLALLLDSPANTISLRLGGSTGCFNIYTPGKRFMDDPFRYYLMQYMSKYRIFTKGYIIFSDAHTHDEIEQVGDVLCHCVEDYMNGAAFNS